jgi:hypothetical protein
MFISVVETGLERLLRSELPLPDDVGDITFDAPTSNWSAQLSRVTVNLFLYDISRSTQPSRAPTQRPGSAGAGERRAPQPMVQLGYLVSTWAGTSRDEHQLLGDVVSALAGVEQLPAQLLPTPLSSTVHLGFAQDQQNRVREIWSALGGSLKASFTLQVNVAADTFEWTEQAAPVDRIEVLSAPIPRARAER